MYSYYIFSIVALLMSYFYFRPSPGGTSKISIFDVIGDFFEGVWESFFGEGTRSLLRSGMLRIYKRDTTQNRMRRSDETEMLQNIARLLKQVLELHRRKVKRDVYLPSFGIAGEIVNDIANTFINTATVWKYQ